MTQVYHFSENELNMPIEEMGLSVRAKHALHSYGVYTLHELLMCIEKNGLNGLRNLGRVSIGEIMNKLEEMDTPEYRDKQSRIREFEKKTAEINAQIAHHNEETMKLNKQLKLYNQQIELLKKQK